MVDTAQTPEALSTTIWQHCHFSERMASEGQKSELAQLKLRFADR